MKYSFGDEDWQENALYAFEMFDVDSDNMLNEDEFYMFAEDIYGFNDEISEDYP